MWLVTVSVYNMLLLVRCWCVVQDMKELVDAGRKS
jgi:hypothetical protein